MASLGQKLIIIIAIFAIAIPLSTCYRRRSRRSGQFLNRGDIEQNLRDLCSRTDKSDVCWNILKSQLNRFDDSDDIGIADEVIDLATEKSKVIGDQLNKWFRDSNDNTLKRKYRSCSQNYNDIERNLDDVHRNLDSDNYQRISNQIDDAEEILDECMQIFNSHTIDPGHVGDRNNEIGLYLQMVRAALNRL